ncbi:DegT/DnrJ/EryC1/StrS aminotransferase family protein [compost metagenome]
MRDDAPFTRRELQIHLETRGIQTRTVFTGNILRQPGFKDIQRREAAEGYANADRVMRGGMLLACHHGLSQAQIDYVHEQFRAFAERHR